MGLVVDYRDQGCRGTFDGGAGGPELVMMPLKAPLLAASLLGAGVLAFLGHPQLVPALLIAAACVCFAPNELRLVSAPQPVVSAFRVDGSWLELRVGALTRRVFLPRSEISLQGLTLRVRSTLAPVDIVIVGALGDEEALRLLAASLAQVKAHDPGTSREIPNALRDLSARAPEQAHASAAPNSQRS